MAFMECRFSSAILGRAVSANVVMPLTAAPGGNKVLYLLHGLSDDASTWFRRSSIERYAERMNFTVIMPDGGRSFYTDALHGAKYWTFISEELPEIMNSIFRISPDRERTFAAGLSMGGYGALKLGLRCPEKFAAVGALSAVADLRSRFRAPDSASWLPELKLIFGDESRLASDGNDLFDLASKALSSGKPLPKIIAICGSEDFMIEDNRRFNRFMAERYPGFHSFERPGSHEWQFWDTHIRDVMAFFDSGKLPE